MTTQKRENIHDRYFKHMFGHANVVAGFLKGTLSKQLLNKLDLSTLKKVEGNFLPNKHRGSRHTDILYAVNRHRSTQKIYMVLHLEGQGKHDKFMGVRVLEYHTAIMRGLIQEGIAKVPTILTFVFYYGKEKWTSTRSIAGLFSDFETYLSEGIRKSFLVELTQHDLKYFQKHGLASMPEAVLSRQSTQDMCALLKSVVPKFTSYEPCCKEETLQYMFQVDKGGSAEFITELTNFDSEAGENYKTMFEKDIRKAERRGIEIGEQRGIEIGEQRGIEIGEQRGMTTIVQRLTRAGFDKVALEKALEEDT